MATYRLNLEAEKDVRRLYRFGIETFGLERADRYFDGLFERFDQLAEKPRLYRAVDDIRPGYRRSVYGAHSIYYRVNGDVIEIMRVLGREDTSVLT